MFLLGFACLEVEEAVSYEGHEIKKISKVSSLDDCKEECKRRDVCIGWTYKERDLDCGIFKSIDLKIAVQIKWSGRCSRELRLSLKIAFFYVNIHFSANPPYPFIIAMSNKFRFAALKMK